MIFLTTIFPRPSFIALLELFNHVFDHERARTLLLCRLWLLVLTLLILVLWSLESRSLFKISYLVEIEGKLVAGDLELVWDLAPLV